MKKYCVIPIDTFLKESDWLYALRHGGDTVWTIHKPSWITPDRCLLAFVDMEDLTAFKLRAKCD